VLVRGARLPFGGISCVSTLSEYRRRGYAGVLCVDSIHRMRERGLCTSGLMPFSYEYYGKFGWCEAGSALVYEAAPADLPYYAEAASVRSFEKEDLPAIARLQAETVGDRSGYFIRSDRWWEVRREFRVGEVAVFDQDGIEGYVGYKLSPKPDADNPSGTARLCELIAGSERAARGLCGFLSQLGDRAEVLRWNTDLASLRASTLDRYPHTIKRSPMFMYRVVDLVPAMRRLFPESAPIDEPLEVRIRDEIGTWNESPLWVTPEGVSTSPVAAACWIEADVRRFSQMHIGYRTAAELASLDLLTASDPQAIELAETIFPHQEPFFPDPDWF
jgi:predicted acetyltransferase